MQGNSRKASSSSETVFDSRLVFGGTGRTCYNEGVNKKFNIRFFEGCMPKNKLRTEKDKYQSNISSENANEK